MRPVEKTLGMQWPVLGALIFWRSIPYSQIPAHAGMTRRELTSGSPK